MRGWGSRTPKRTTIWSNSSAVRFFCTSRKARKYWLGSGTKLVDVYYNSRGERKFKGNQNLRKSQWIGIWLIYMFLFDPKCPILCFPLWPKPRQIHHILSELREYPVPFGVRFAETMNKFKKERSPPLRTVDVPYLHMVFVAQFLVNSWLRTL